MGLAVVLVGPCFLIGFLDLDFAFASVGFVLCTYWYLVLTVLAFWADSWICYNGGCLPLPCVALDLVSCLWSFL